LDIVARMITASAILLALTILTCMIPSEAIRVRVILEARLRPDTLVRSRRTTGAW
jgi:hypothetical protein